MAAMTLSPGTATAVTSSIPPVAAGFARLKYAMMPTMIPTTTNAITTGCQGGMVHLALSNSSPIGTCARSYSAAGFFGAAAAGRAGAGGGVEVLGGVVGVSFSGMSFLVVRL